MYIYVYYTWVPQVRKLFLDISWQTASGDITFLEKKIDLSGFSSREPFSTDRSINKDLLIKLQSAKFDWFTSAQKDSILKIGLPTLWLSIRVQTVKKELIFLLGVFFAVT